MLRKQTIDALETMFQRHPVMRAHEGASEGEISTAERRLGCKFHDQYREFLVRFGAAMVGADPVYGLRQLDLFDVNLWSVVDVTLAARSEKMPGSEGWYVFSDDSAGNIYGIATDGRVWVSYHDTETVSLVASDFEDWLRTRLE